MSKDNTRNKGVEVKRLTCTVKERPILFSTQMVRALLNGSKTQTRRVVKPHRADDAFVLLDHGDGWWPYRSDDGESPNYDNNEIPLNCPHGRPGDRLWVRETWSQPTNLDPGPTLYRADYPACVPTHFTNLPAADEITWKPSIHMLRRDSRILLEIEAVRVERLNDCSSTDAIAEGTHPDEVRQFDVFGMDSAERAEVRRRAAIAPYKRLWESINGAGSWAGNPWVWVVEFKRVTA